MKTKEIEVWVESDLLREPIEGYYTMATNEVDGEQYESPMIKARLIIEIQEQKVEITESQLEAAWKKYHYAPHTFGFSAFKKELGFTSGDE